MQVVMPFSGMEMTKGDTGVRVWGVMAMEAN